ncbi:MAG TPA: DMT family transporter [Thermodesulfobacteriota bacterium]
MAYALFVLVALVAGAGLPLQSGINAQLVRFVGHPVLAALVSFLVGTAALAAYAAASRLPVSLARLAEAPLWAWTGGFIGAAFVAVAAALAPRLGATFFVGVVVAGQMIASLVLDHFGLVGFPRYPLSPARLLGAALVVLGVALLRRV